MGRKKGPKRQKKKLVFDENDRVEYLTGLRKRNIERRRKRREKLNNMLKEEMKKIKRNKKEALKNALISQRQVPEIEHLLKPVTIDLPAHTVTISEFEDFNSVPVTKPFPAVQEIDDLRAQKNDDEVEKIQKLIKDMKAKKIQPSKNSKLTVLAKKQQRKDDKIKAKRHLKELRKFAKPTKKKHSNKKKK